MVLCLSVKIKGVSDCEVLWFNLEAMFLHGLFALMLVLDLDQG